LKEGRGNVPGFFFDGRLCVLGVLGEENSVAQQGARKRMRRLTYLQFSPSPAGNWGSLRCGARMLGKGQEEYVFSAGRNDAVECLKCRTKHTR